MTTIDGNLHVNGALFMGSFQQANARVFPQENVPTSVEVFGINVRGSGPLNAQATASTTVPGSRVSVVGVKIVSDSQLEIWVHRSNEVSTSVHWQVWREP
jgi:hypothetical protein